MSDEQTTPENGGGKPAGGKSRARKKHKLLRFIVILVIILIGLPLIAELVFFLTRIAPGSVIPDSFAVYAAAPNPASLAEKVLDHESLPAIMANPALSSFTPLVNQLKESKALENRWVRFALRGSISAAITSMDTGSPPTVIAAWDSGVLAPFLRLLPYIVPRLNIQGLHYVQGTLSRFEYRSGDRVFYIAPKRNLLVVSSSEDLFTAAMAPDGASYSPGKSIKSKKGDLALLLSSRTVTQVLSENNPLLVTALRQVDFPLFMELALSVERSRLTISLVTPVETNNEDFGRILGKNSAPPSLMRILPDTTQYCTGLSAAGLEDLLRAVSAASGPGLQNTLDTADKAAHTLLGMGLEDILFSWTGDEFAVFGLEERADPVFAIKIRDEKRRQEVFDKIFESIFVKEDARLVLDGNRIPQIRLPVFINAVLKLLEINIPSPYYTVHEGWLLVSESPENILTSVNAVRQSHVLPRTDAWRALSSGAAEGDSASLSLYYSLDRTLPFFLKGGSPAAALLRMYRQGLLRASIKDKTLTLNLSVIPGAGRGVEPVPGYPLALGGRTGKTVYAVMNAAKTESRLLIGRGTTALAVNPADKTIYEYPGDDPVWVIPTGRPPRNIKEASAWVVSSSGLVTLISGNMEPAPGYPIITGIKPSASPVSFGGRLFLAAEEGDGGVLYTLDPASREVHKLDMGFSSPLLSAPSFIESGNRAGYMAVYPKSFLGELYLLSLEAQVVQGWPVYASGIAFGTPELFRPQQGTAGTAGGILAAFITMAGELSVYAEDGSLVPGFPLEIPGVFYLQPVWDGEFLWVVSEGGILYRISLGGIVSEQRVPGLKVKEEGYIMVQDVDGDGIPEIFITGEGNALYGFARTMNSLEGFPLPVWGRPAFADLDGDGKMECSGAGMDNKLYRWNFK